MATTFIDLTNKALQRINETPIRSVETSLGQSLQHLRGIQALAATSIQDSVNKINAQEFEWPFNQSSKTDILVVGKGTYSFPSTFKVADWSSFVLKSNLKEASTTSDDIVIEPVPLRVISRDEFYSSYRRSSLDATNVGVPRYIYSTHEFGYGLYPNPDKEYKIDYKYYVTPVKLAYAKDQSRIPEPFDYVIIDGACFYLYLHNDNVESASLMEESFKRGIKAMQNLLFNKSEYVSDRRI